LKHLILAIILSVCANLSAQVCNNSYYEFIPSTVEVELPENVLIELSSGSTVIDQITIPPGIYSDANYPVLFSNSPLSNGEPFTMTVIDGDLMVEWKVSIFQADIIGGANNTTVDWEGTIFNPGAFEISYTADFDFNGNSIGGCVDYMPNYVPATGCHFAIDFDLVDNLQSIEFWKDELNLMYNWGASVNDTVAIDFNTIDQYIRYVDYSGLNRPVIVTTKFNGVVTTTTLFSGDQIDVDATGAACNAALPVELISFTGKAQNARTVKLEWATASEVNNKGFEVLHSTTGNNFKVVFFADGKGTTDIISRYSFEHTTDGTNYYQLRQVDYDGESEMSDILVVELPTNVPQVYPNPAKDIINYRIGNELFTMPVTDLPTGRNDVYLVYKDKPYLITFIKI
jgi:hypothetical protein